MRVRKSVAAAETTIKNFEAEARLHRLATAGGPVLRIAFVYPSDCTPRERRWAS